jgi:clan AA aspartic protease
MMYGFVNSALEAMLTVEVQDATGTWQPLDALIDTGFTGELVLPSAFVKQFGGLPFEERQQVMLGDGSILLFDAHSAVILWDGTPRAVRVLAGAISTVGTALLEGCDLHIDMRRGRAVTVTVLP